MSRVRFVLTKRKNRYSQRCGHCRYMLAPREGQLVKVTHGTSSWWEPYHRECAVGFVDEVEKGA
ncbi:MAG TPA: hypothetical protein VF158_14520 [Longimicrobiales bacterium]